jgi:hypothetical protein
MSTKWLIIITFLVFNELRRIILCFANDGFTSLIPEFSSDQRSSQIGPIVNRQ